jgi:hypothetical protein
MDMARECNKLGVALYDFAVREVFQKICERAGFKSTDKVAAFDTYQSENQIKIFDEPFFHHVHLPADLQAPLIVTARYHRTRR